MAVDLLSVVRRRMRCRVRRGRGPGRSGPRLRPGSRPRLEALLRRSELPPRWRSEVTPRLEPLRRRRELPPRRESGRGCDFGPVFALARPIEGSRPPRALRIGHRAARNRSLDDPPGRRNRAAAAPVLRGAPGDRFPRAPRRLERLERALSAPVRGSRRDARGRGGLHARRRRDLPPRRRGGFRGPPGAPGRSRLSGGRAQRSAPPLESALPIERSGLGAAVPTPIERPRLPRGSGAGVGPRVGRRRPQVPPSVDPRGFPRSHFVPARRQRAGAIDDRPAGSDIRDAGSGKAPAVGDDDVLPDGVDRRSRKRPLSGEKRCEPR